MRASLRQDGHLAARPRLEFCRCTAHRLPRRVTSACWRHDRRRRPDWSWPFSRRAGMRGTFGPLPLVPCDISALEELISRYLLLVGSKAVVKGIGDLDNIALGPEFVERPQGSVSRGARSHFRRHLREQQIYPVAQIAGGVCNLGIFGLMRRECVGITRRELRPTYRRQRSRRRHIRGPSDHANRGRNSDRALR
jgi:hypothetical protein